MANRFLNNITINDQYTFPSSDGTNGQILSTTGAANGTTELQFIDQSNIVAGEAEIAKTLQVTVKNVSGGELAKGTVVHVSPSLSPPSGNVVEVIAADYDDATKMPAVGILKETIADDAEGEAVMSGALSGIATDGFTAGDELYVGADGALTNTKPQTAGQLIQKIAVCVKSHESNGLIKIFGAGRSNDVPLPLYIDNTNQRVGIGEPSPQKTLDIDGDGLVVQNNTDKVLDVNAIDGNFAIGDIDGLGGNAFIASADATHIDFLADGDVRFRNNGYVGIGTPNPSQKLEVTGNGLFGNGNTPITFQIGEATGYTNQTCSTLKLAQGGGNYHEFRGIKSSDEEGSIYRMQEYTDGSLMRMTQTYDGETTHILYGNTISLSGNVTTTGDLTVSGGDITLGGTGRIKGIDTVSAGTDAVNKDYVDTNFASSSHHHDNLYYRESEADARFVNVTGDTMSGSLDVNADIQSNTFTQAAHGIPRSNLGSPTVTEMALFDSQFTPKTTLANSYNDLTDLTFWVQTTSSSAWTEVTTYSDDQKRRFLRTNNSSVIIPNGAYKFRVEFKAKGYTYANALYMYWSSQSHNSKVRIWKYNFSQDSWIQHTYSNTTVSSWPGHLWLPFSTIPWHETHETSTSHHRYIRVEFEPTWSTGQYSDRDILLYGGQIWGGYPSGRRTPHYYDQNGVMKTWENNIFFHDGYHPNADTWTTGRTITIGNTGKSVNGSANVSWSLSEIGAAAASHNHTSLTGVTNISFNAHSNDSASISTTINENATYFDFNLTDDNNDDWWRWRFNPTGSTVYDAMTLKPVSNGNANLTVSGNISADNLSGTNTGDQDLSGYLTTTGKAADSNLLDGIDSSRIVYGSGSRKTYNQDPNTAFNSGFYDIFQTNAPTNTWYSYLTMAHTNAGNMHGHQIAGSFYSDGDLFNRHYDGNGSFGNWTRIWNAANDGAGSGLDADLLDGSQGSAYIKENEDRRYKIIRFTGEGGNSANSTVNYGIYQEGGNWTSPFPDLVIGYHTGIKIGGYKDYNGTRFYNDAPGRSGASMILSVGDGSDNVVATSSFRAPVFYDSNDTSYYLNPASHSHFNTLTLAGNRIGFINTGFDAEIRVSDDNPNGTGAEFVFYGDGSAGNAQLTAEVGNFTANVRAPIFYDLNNTIYRFDGSASNNGLDLTSSGNYAIHVAGTISGGHRKHVNLETPEMEWSVGGSTDLNWKKLCDVVISDAGYSGWGAEIEITDFSGNFGNAAYNGGELFKGALSIHHWGGAGYAPEFAAANIPYEMRNHVRWYKINESGQNRYQLQVKSPANYRQLYVKIKPGIGNQVEHILSYANDTNGATSGGTAYASTQAANFNHEFAGGIWTNDTRNIGWKNSYGNPYLSSYYGAITTSGTFYVGGASSTTTNLYSGYSRASVFYDRTSSAYYMDGNSTGDSIRVAGDVVAFYSSDKRYKENIKPIENALDKVKAINGVTFNWNEKSHKETGKKDVGVIAQEVEEVLPDIVETRRNGYKAVDYQKLTAVLIESVKELTAKVEALEAKQCNCK